MVRRRRRLDRPIVLTGLLLASGTLGLLALSGCASSPPPASPAATSRTAPSPPLEPAAAEAEPQPEPTADTPDGSAPASDTAEADRASKGATGSAGPDGTADSSNVIVIDRGAGGSKPSLWEAAVAERKRRATAKRSIASVTNENLHEYQDAELTFAQSKGEASGEEARPDGMPDAEGGTNPKTDKPADAGAEAEVHGEQYWRSRVLDLRTQLRDAADTIDDLQERIATLRRKFYAEDDPYVRDGEIKPAWDRALDRLDRTHQKVDRLRKELTDTLEEGHREGALPGWLREGIELEPHFDDTDRPAGRDGDLKIYEPTEPDTIDPEQTRPPDGTGSKPPPARP